MRARAIKLRFFAAVALALAVAAPVSATTITFGDTSGLVTSGTTVKEAGFDITGVGGSFLIVDAADCPSPFVCADDGTHFALTLFTPPAGTPGTASAIAIQASDGSEFSFQGFSGAEGIDPRSWASGIRVTVLTAGGLTGHEDFTLDQINDGTGGLADFQSFTSGSTGLLFVQIIFSGLAGNNGIDFGIDNIVLNEPVPEPTTLLLFGSSLAIAGVRRRMKKRG